MLCFLSFFSKSDHTAELNPQSGNGFLLLTHKTFSLFFRWSHADAYRRWWKRSGLRIRIDSQRTSVLQLNDRSQTVNGYGSQFSSLSSMLFFTRVCLFLEKVNELFSDYSWIEKYKEDMLTQASDGKNRFCNEIEYCHPCELKLTLELRCFYLLTCLEMYLCGSTKDYYRLVLALWLV